MKKLLNNFHLTPAPMVRSPLLNGEGMPGHQWCAGRGELVTFHRSLKAAATSIKLILILFIAIYFAGCYGEQVDLTQFPINNPPGRIGDTVYIPISPVLTGYNNPLDIYIGNEPLIYVADNGNNRVVQLDISGSVIGYSNFILKPKKIAQDRNYDLLVIGSVIDTIPPNILDTVDAVYRLKLQQNNGLISGVNPAIVFKSNQPTPIPGNHGKFTGIAAFYNNYYLVLRAGPNNSNFIDPDNAIFMIDKYDHTFPVPTRLSGFEVNGQGLLSLIETSSITTFSGNANDFIYTETSSNVAFKIQWCIYDAIDEIYTPKFTPGSPVDLIKPGLVSQPQDITLDKFNNIYVVDSQKDSVYKFNSLGALRSESFGGPGTGTSQFSGPMGIAFFDKTLYIADSGNNRILRFILSTDIH
jgi:hypothetical protein